MAATRGRGKIGGTKSRRRALAPADYQLLAEFRYVLRQFLAFSEAAAERAGLTPQQHQALLALKGHRGEVPLTTGGLAERLAIRHHSAVGLIDRLCAKDLVRRSSPASDRRRVLIELTPHAEELLHELTRDHRRELKRIAPLLSQLLKPFARRR